MAHGRKAERVTINKEFESFDQFMSEYVTNLSRTGAFIRTSTPLPVGTEVDLRFTVVLEGVEVIEGIGEVVRLETSPPGMGITFKELYGDSQALIERLLARNAKAEPG
ncbi:MAG TPA: PilZ domain-containing protein [Polyangiaceae bacterium]|nr:PilZ domain-containing protein [Polyangiaceae bacterium]